jgi:hypothetical protein
MTHSSNSTDADYVDCFDIKAVAARIHAVLFPEIPINAPIKALADFEPLRAEQVQAQAVTTQPIPPQSPRRQHKPRKPSIATLIKRAEKTGQRVTSITLPDGTTLTFGETTPTDANNPWLTEIEKATKQ